MESAQGTWRNLMHCFGKSPSALNPALHHTVSTQLNIFAHAKCICRKLTLCIYFPDSPEEEKESLMEKMKEVGKRKRKLEQEKGELQAQIGSVEKEMRTVEKDMKSLKKLMKKVRKRKKSDQKVEEGKDNKKSKFELNGLHKGVRLEFAINLLNGFKIRHIRRVYVCGDGAEKHFCLTNEKCSLFLSLHIGGKENEEDELQIEMGRLQKENNELQVELKWRRTHRYADDITLNPDTAHPNLSISEDKKKITHETQPKTVLATPERFDSTVSVLGSEGFSDGKHYWEVDVRSSNDWDLGVAVKSIERKGKLFLSPKEGFWDLGWSGRDYWAKTDPWTWVKVQKKPEKIGVYLSYQEGQVTFFNVTDMSVLFTFNDCSFSGEVYPFFKNSHKKTSMRICSLREDE
ncbi:butyrophilin subfamily 2 member A1-like [Trachemys scripta elegans]|uniref:butyrophilin subfamily 2 member A1-like n=1 Tax=Trachemys scripta elegans TaxID=31138 RepID=UPI0015563D00|nr:butyrophilin subfamily 2 member A1-like [Trachemys scripta elegans]